MWNFGISASGGAYLLPQAESSLPPGRDLSDYKQIVLAQDISFAWHHLEVWAEFYETRFEVPRIGNADTFAYYIEAKYKFTPQLSGALRWNQQLFGTIDHEGEDAKWGNDLWRIDAALTYRFTERMQIKLQYSIQDEENAPHQTAHNFAGQFTVRF
jgi:predicted porin